MHDLSWDEAEPLLLALADPSASVRVAALRALVRLSLSREVWIKVSQTVLGLLQETPQGASFNSQTLDGMCPTPTPNV